MKIWIPMNIWWKIEAVYGWLEARKSARKALEPSVNGTNHMNMKSPHDVKERTMSTDAWKKIKEKITVIGYRYIIRKTFELPNGKISHFDVNHEGESASVVALTPQNTVLLVWQYRPGPEAVLLELPGGGVNPGEKPEDAIQRELLEETGYQGEIQAVGSNFLCAYSDAKRYNFVARNCVKIQEITPDAHEFLEVVELSLEEFIQHVRSGQMTNVEGAYMALDALHLLGTQG